MADPSPYGRFQQLHQAQAPLLLPNAWDFASAAFLAAAGHTAIGTTSLGVAAIAGKADATSSTRPETLALATLMADLDVLVTVDIEGGFSDDPDEVAQLAAELAAVGVVGVNIEDGRPTGQLSPTSLCTAKIRAIKARVPDLFVNARTDAYWLAGSCTDPLAETLARRAAFTDAGADGFFVPGMMPIDVVAEIAHRSPLPLNMLHRPGIFSPERAADLGIARISTGSLLYRLALGAMLQGAYELNPQLSVPDKSRTPTYAEVQRMLPDDAAKN